MNERQESGYEHPIESDDESDAEMNVNAYWNSLDDDDRRVLARQRAIQFMLHHPSVQIV